MGVVFKGRQAALDREVAVKFLHAGSAVDRGHCERFRQEARALAKLQHPNLVQVYEYGELPGPGGSTSQPYLVLEYVAGGNLADLLRGKPQPPRQAAQLVATLAEAMHYAHGQGIFHRDLKPANILLQGSGVRSQESGARSQGSGGGTRQPGLRFASAGSVQGHGAHDTTLRARNVNQHSALTPDPSPLTPKITDFGLAKFASGSDLTQTGEVLGTPSYMAPEQTLGKFGVVSAAVDVYGLGAILYEAITGLPPFQAETTVATVNLVRQADPVSPCRLQPTVPHDLETICLKCLRKEPGRRYATAQDLADDLRRFLAGEPIRARPVGTRERVLVWCRRRPAVAGLLALLALVLLAGSLGVFWQWHRAARNAAEAVQLAAAFRRERDVANQEKKRAEGHLQLIRQRVDRLSQLGVDLLRRPGHFRAGKAVLEEALGFYQGLLPDESDDPGLRKQAAGLYRHVGEIHHYLGQMDQAAEAYRQRGELLSSLLGEEPGDARLRLALADSYRWRGNELRDLGKPHEARQAYDQAAVLHQALLRESPNEARLQMSLANTLLNAASVLSRRDHVQELESLYAHMLELYRAAALAAPRDLECQTELALGLENQGLFLLDIGQSSRAERAVREAMDIHQKLLDGGFQKFSMQRFLARNHVSLGRILAATDRASEAEAAYRKAVDLLNPVVAAVPEFDGSPAELAQTLVVLANQVKKSGRLREAADIRRQASSYYERLRTDFPENVQYQRNLVQNYLEEVELLGNLGRPTKAAELLRKAFKQESDDPGVSNELAWFLATIPALSLRDPALAVRLARKAVADQPQTANYHNTLGVAYYRSGDDKAAVAELEKAVSLRAGGDSFDWFFLAMAHRRLGNRDRARNYFDQAVQWMKQHQPQDDELRRFCAEAAALVAETQPH
jgi:serine/threonine protein kinase/tetratricopeptide (TPR) repeat protein